MVTSIFQPMTILRIAILSYSLESTMGSIPYGLTGLLKEGYKLYSGINQVVQKNIDACKELSQITRTSIGPNGDATF